MQKQTKSAQELRRIGAAQAFCEARLALGRVTLSLTDLVKESELSAIAAKRQLSRLRGKVVRISPRQPFFLIVSPEHRSLGAPPANWWLQHYFDWLGRPYYLALQSAASAFGSNPQALQVTQVMTDRPCRAIKVGRIQVKFFVKRGIDRTPTQQPAGGVAPLLVSTPEATAFDLIRYRRALEELSARRKPSVPSVRSCHFCAPVNSSGCSTRKTNLLSHNDWGFVIETGEAKKLAEVVRDWLAL